MAKSKTRLIAEFMRGVQSDNDNNAVHSEVQAAANAVATDVYTSSEVDAMFDEVIAEVETIALQGETE